jgi:low affinity Fe/Cu permease
MTLDPWTIFATAVIVALGGSLVRGLYVLIRSLAAMSKNIDKLLEADSDHMVAIAAIAKLQRPQLAAHKATLDALKEGRCNGSVTQAQEMITKAFDDYDDFLVGRL